MMHSHPPPYLYNVQEAAAGRDSFISPPLSLSLSLSLSPSLSPSLRLSASVEPLLRTVQYAMIPSC